MKIASCPARMAIASAVAPVPPVGRSPISSIGTGGTVYPQRSRGSEFNALAPQMPERLIATRPTVSRQHQMSRAPPMLESMACHD